jgi:hypothetical protein
MYGIMPEVVLPDLENMRDTRQQLTIYGKPAILRLRCPRHHAHCKLMLIHDHSRPENGTMCQEFEGEWRRDVVRNVGNTQIKVGQLCLQKVSVDDLQLGLQQCALKAACQLENLRTLRTAECASFA